MSVEGQARREKSGKSPPTLLEVSVALVVAVLLVLTGVRLLGGFGVVPYRGGQAAIAADAPVEGLVLTKASRTSH